MRVLLDTNVLLDALLERRPWYESAVRLWEASINGKFIGCVAATELTNLYYVANKVAGASKAHVMARTVLELFEVLPITYHILRAAADLAGADFEDDVLIACAYSYRIDAIVTRNPSDFKSAKVLVQTPDEFIRRFPFEPNSAL